MKNLSILIIVITCGLGVFAQPDGKKIYIPNDLRNNDFCQDSSQWSYSRMACTKDVAVFWERPYGDDLSKAPNLEGKSMTVDLPNLLDKLQKYYEFYRDSLKFVLPGSKSDDYRMMAMINYTLESTVYGGEYDGEIGAMWIAPGRIQDKPLNAVAHELGHSFQSQVFCDGYKRGLKGSIYEMCSQWMLWQVNPYWMDDETYHWNDFKRLAHLRFLHNENRYHSPFVLEYWSEHRGLSVMADLFRDGKSREDCAAAYMRHFGLSVEQMNEEMFDCCSHILAMDYRRLGEIVSKYAFQIKTPLVEAENGWQQPESKFVPQIWGFNAIPLSIEGKKNLKVKVQSLLNAGEGGVCSGLVYVDKQGRTIYSKMSGKKETTLSLSLKDVAKVYLVVMGAPKKYKSMNTRYDIQDEEMTFPYKFKVQ